MFPDPILYGRVQGSRSEIERAGSKKSGMTVSVSSVGVGSTDIRCITEAVYNKRRDSIDIEVKVIETKTGKVLKTLSYQSNENDI